jgi:enoyl-CoA hydratase/carnithine racemase
MSTNYENLIVEMSAPIARVTLNRPERRNALSLALMRELTACLREIGGSAEIRAVILSAAGGVFSSGHDLTEMRGRSINDYRRIFDACVEMMNAVQSIPQPVIAEVQGMATAAGCQLVAACDMAVAAEEAKFATPGVRIGLFCSTPMVALTRAIGRKRALEMLMTGTPIDARTAAEWGLVNHVVPAAGLRDFGFGPADHRSKPARRRHRQTGLLHADRSRSGQGLRLRQGGHEPERDGG